MPTPAHPAARRGGVYLAVLGAAIVVSIVGLSAMTVVRLEMAASEAGADALKCRFYAESALELGMLEIASNPLWRSTRPNGVWRADQTIGDGLYSLEGRDPTDADLGNNARDPVVLRGVGRRGTARHITEVTLVDTGDPISALTAALAVTGDIQVNAGRTLTVSGAPASSNATLRNNGTIAGSAQALLILNSGTITGSSTSLSLGLAMPPAGLWQVYAKMGTQIAPGTSIENCVLSPKLNPFGAPDPDGVYFIDAAGDFRIRNLRVNGTLVINCPGTVEIHGMVHLQNHQRDCPALIVNGNLRLAYDSSQALDEAVQLVNFNPDGAPYQGATDTDTLDKYPNEIRGLVHATGTLSVIAASRVVGCVIAQSPNLLNAATIDANCELVYDPRILERPPIGYSTNPTMRPREGSWVRVTLP